MPRKQLYELTCDRCGHTETSADYGLEWGHMGAILHLPQFGGIPDQGGGLQTILHKQTVGGGNHRNAILCPACSRELWAWWQIKPQGGLHAVKTG